MRIVCNCSGEDGATEATTEALSRLHRPQMCGWSCEAACNTGIIIMCVRARKWLVVTIRGRTRACHHRALNAAQLFEEPSSMSRFGLCIKHIYYLMLQFSLKVEIGGLYIYCIPECLFKLCDMKSCQ